MVLDAEKALPANPQKSQLAQILDQLDMQLTEEQRQQAMDAANEFIGTAEKNDADAKDAMKRRKRGDR